MAFSNQLVASLYESLSDEGKAEIDRLSESLDTGADDAEVLKALIDRLYAEQQERLVGTGLGRHPYAQNNTWPHVREIRNEIAGDYGTHLTDLDFGWNKLSADYGELLRRDRDEAFGSTPLEAFLMLLREGYYPPPEILIAVADCFEAYFVRGGEVSMDLFFKELGHKVGDFAAQRYKERPMIEFEMMRRLNKLRTKEAKKDADTLLLDFLLSESRAPEPSQRLREFMARSIRNLPKSEQAAWIKELESDFDRKRNAHAAAYDKAEAGLAKRKEQQKEHRKKQKPED